MASPFDFRTRTANTTAPSPISPTWSFQEAESEAARCPEARRSMETLYLQRGSATDFAAECRFGQKQHALAGENGSRARPRLAVRCPGRCDGMLC